MASEIFQKPDEKFYLDAINYWSEIPATIDGMLGGFGFISLTDIKGSKMLLKQLFNSKCPPGRGYALDCGAGIGRITKFLLTDLFDKVDMVEQNQSFLEQAKQYLGAKKDKIGHYYAVGLQDFKPELRKYDVIWIQWVLGHLTNKDLLQFLENCKNGLKENGVIVVKENITSSDDLELDRNDSSVTRSMTIFQDLFSKANFDCYRLVKQPNFPKGLYSVYMFILKPKIKNEEKESLKTETMKTDSEANGDNSNKEISEKVEVTSELNFEKDVNSLENVKDDENIQFNVNSHHVDTANKMEGTEIVKVLEAHSDALLTVKINDNSPQITNEKCTKMEDEDFNCDTFKQSVG